MARAPSPDVSRRLGHAVGVHMVSLDERDRIVKAHDTSGAQKFTDLPADVQALVLDIETRPFG